jgi:hypothetical protein
MLHAWPNTSGNYTGTTVTDNYVDCGGLDVARRLLWDRLDGIGRKLLAVSRLNGTSS